MVNYQQQLLISQKSEIKHSSIRLSELIDRGSRLNADYYNIESKKIRELINNYDRETKKLNGERGFAKCVSYQRFKRIFINEGIPIYSASQILDLIPIPRKFISDKTKTNLKKLYLAKGQIVMTCSGTVGQVNIVGDTLDGKLFSHDLIRINILNQLDVGYVYAFLKSKIGQSVVTTNNYGSVVTHIEPEHLENIDVPVPPKEFREKISQKIIKVISNRDRANELISKSNQLFFEFLGFNEKSLKPKYFAENEFLNYSLQASKLENRFETTFHNPIIDEIIKYLKKTGMNILTLSDKEITDDIILPGRFKRIYVSEENGIPFLGGKEITQTDQINKKFLSLKHHGTRIQKELLLKENMVLITCSGTIGNTVLCPKQYENWSCSQHVIRLVPSTKINPGYLYTYLASDIGKRLIIRNKYGSVVDEIDNKQVGKIPIILPEKKVQNAIGDLVLEANKLRSEAYFLEKEAVREVENHILKNQL